MSRFGHAAKLLLPADDGIGAAVAEADRSWTLPRPDGPDVLVWGRLARPQTAALPGALAEAAAREQALATLRLGRAHGYQVLAVHRLSPPSLRRGGARARARTALLGGVLVELSRVGRYVRVLDRAVGGSRTGREHSREADRVRTGRLHVGMGAALSTQVTWQGARGVLRIAAAAAPADPPTAGQALDRLAEAGFAWAPRLLANGETADATWTVESWLPGRPPRTLSTPLTEQLAATWSVLPVAAGPPLATERDVATIAAALPDQADRIQALLTGHREVLATLPAVLRHGDLWTGNVLVEGSRLVGAIDWDAWASDGVPGGDLLQLVATDRRTRAGWSLGAMFDRTPWRDESFRSATAGYWQRLGIDADDGVLDAVGFAWWAAEVAGTLARLPERRTDRSWLAANLTPLRSVDG